VLRTVATTGAGVAELVETIGRFRERTGGALTTRRRSRAEWRLREILSRRFMDHVEHDVLAPGELDALLDRIAAREVDPYGGAESVFQRTVGGAASAPSLDHVGVAVRDAADLTAIFERLFGLSTDQPEAVGQHRVRFVGTAGTTIELVEPIAPDAPVARFLDKRGPGLHHLCLRVPDIEAAMAQLKARGAAFIDETPRPGAHGSRIAFLKPASVGGLLVELKQP
jgi:methylmalonyl-CoA epimerase